MVSESDGSMGVLESETSGAFMNQRLSGVLTNEMDPEGDF